MSEQYALLKRLCDAPGPSGREDAVRAVFRDELGADDGTDRLGSIFFKHGKGDGPCVMLTAHMDEIGFMVTHITNEGFLKFHTLGGFDPKTLTAQRVIIHGKKDVIGVMASKPIHVMTADERNKVAKLSDYFIDTGLTAEEVKELVEIGTPITREREFIEMGNCVNGKSLDNRLAVFILIECLKELKGKSIPYDLYAVFTVQEEVGIRGANVSSLKINPDFIAIEPPELIGSGKAISTEKPDLIQKAARIVNDSKNKTKLLCGAGIVSGDDVVKSIELGSKGILVASGIIKAKNWNKIISEFAKALV